MMVDSMGVVTQLIDAWRRAMVAPQAAPAPPAPPVPLAPTSASSVPLPNSSRTAHRSTGGGPGYFPSRAPFDCKRRKSTNNHQYKFQKEEEEEEEEEEKDKLSPGYLQTDRSREYRSAFIGRCSSRRN